MNVKRYAVTTADAFDTITITLDVDLDVLTPELASEINRFWTEADDRLAAADDNVIHAALKLAAANFLQWALEGNNVYGCNSEMANAEGWPQPCPIRFVSIDGMPEWDSKDFAITEVAQPKGEPA